jgi:hypothetical protein
MDADTWMDNHLDPQSGIEVVRPAGPPRARPAGRPQAGSPLRAERRCASEPRVLEQHERLGVVHDRHLRCLRHDLDGRSPPGSSPRPGSREGRPAGVTASAWPLRGQATRPPTSVAAGARGYSRLSADGRTHAAPSMPFAVESGLGGECSRDGTTAEERPTWGQAASTRKRLRPVRDRGQDLLAVELDHVLVVRSHVRDVQGSRSPGHRCRDGERGTPG